MTIHVQNYSRKREILIYVLHRTGWGAIVLKRCTSRYCTGISLSLSQHFLIPSQVAQRLIFLNLVWRRKWANALLKKKKKIKHFAQFPKLSREMLLFWNSIFSKSSYKKKKILKPYCDILKSISWRFKDL